ncbi:MAG: hypothetical protein M0R80_02450 [Proteobacteria bacterium]|jgi:hypothetical protein|nr:hypothetical protein [Pseudomonadota bacterium]
MTFLAILFAILFVAAVIGNFLQTIFWSRLCKEYKKICDDDVETIKLLTAELKKWSKLPMPTPIEDYPEIPFDLGGGYGLPGRGDE